MTKTFPFRLAQLILGLYIFGWGVALMVHAGIGVGPWDVLAQGLANKLHLSFGEATLVVSLLVVLGWIPLRQRINLGTVLNALLIGLFADSVFPLLWKNPNYLSSLGEFLLGMLVMAFATGMYIAANLGAGPRDGLMIGTAKTFGRPLWQVRTIYEVSVMTIGWLLGGQVREGTLIFALGIGYLMQTSLRLWKVSGHARPEPN